MKVPVLSLVVILAYFIRGLTDTTYSEYANNIGVGRNFPPDV